MKDQGHHIIPEYILKRMGLEKLLRFMPKVYIPAPYHRLITTIIQQTIGYNVVLKDLPRVLRQLYEIYQKYPLPPLWYIK